MKRERFVPLLMALVAVGAAARAISLQFLRPLNWDEIEHFRASEWIRDGLVPFRDFWEHHTPLLWYLGAPFTALTGSQGVDAVVLMRWTQAPLWIVTFWLLNLWMRDAGLGQFARWAGILAAASSSLLMIPAVEYRQDTLANLLFVAGLVLLQRSTASARNAFFAGVVFCFAGLANLRLGPLLAITVLLARIVNPREKRWVGVPRVNWTYAGVIVTLGLACAFFASNGSLRPLVQSVWMENFVGNRIQEAPPYIFVDRITTVFGYSLTGSRGQAPFSWGAVDVGGILALVAGSIGAMRVLVRNRREPDALFFLACLHFSNFLFVAAMKFVYNYHFVTVVVLAVPFIAAEAERFTRREVVVALLVLACAVNVGASIFRGKEHDRAYQDVIMREAHRQTAPDAPVWGGAAWVRDRRPAYRYWFLPSLVMGLEKAGYFEPYRLEQVLADPPGAVIGDYYVSHWLATRDSLRQHFTTHYLPLWRSLWIPAPNALLLPQRPAASWRVPADGVYRLYASRALARHPWFFRPLLVTQVHTAAAQRLEVRTASIANDAAVEWRVNGAVVAGPSVRLRKHDRIEARLLDATPAAVLAVRGDHPFLFMQPRVGVTLEGISAPVTHVPDFTPRIR